VCYASARAACSRRCDDPSKQSEIAGRLLIAVQPSLSGWAGHHGKCQRERELMTCTVIFEANAKNGNGVQLLETFRALLPNTRNKDGCQGVEVTTNLDNADNLVLVERWATRKHYENYLAWRQQRGDIDKLAQALAGPPSIRYFDLTSVQVRRVTLRH